MGIGYSISPLTDFEVSIPTSLHTLVLFFLLSQLWPAHLPCQSARLTLNDLPQRLCELGNTLHVLEFSITALSFTFMPTSAVPGLGIELVEITISECCIQKTAVYI